MNSLNSEEESQKGCVNNSNQDAVSQSFDGASLKNHSSSSQDVIIRGGQDSGSEEEKEEENKETVQDSRQMNKVDKRLIREDSEEEELKESRESYQNTPTKTVLQMIKESIKAKNKIKGEKYKIGKSVFVATIDSSDPNEKLDPKNIMLMFSTDLDFLRKILSKVKNIFTTKSSVEYYTNKKLVITDINGIDIDLKKYKKKSVNFITATDLEKIPLNDLYPQLHLTPRVESQNICCLLSCTQPDLTPSSNDNITFHGNKHLMLTPFEYTGDALREMGKIENGGNNDGTAVFQFNARQNPCKKQTHFDRMSNKNHSQNNKKSIVSHQDRQNSFE